MRIPIEEARGIAARAWTHDSCAFKLMDPVLAEAFAQELVRYMLNVNPEYLMGEPDKVYLGKGCQVDLVNYGGVPLKLYEFTTNTIIDCDIDELCIIDRKAWRNEKPKPQLKNFPCTMSVDVEAFTVEEAVNLLSEHMASTLCRNVVIHGTGDEGDCYASR